MLPKTAIKRTLQFVEWMFGQAFSVAILLFYLCVIVSPIIEGDWDRFNELTFTVAGGAGASFVWRRLIRRYDGALWVPFPLFPLPVGIFAVGLLTAFSGLDLPVFPDIRATVLSAERETISSGDTLLRVQLKLEAVRGAHGVEYVWNDVSLYGNGDERYEALYTPPDAAGPSPCTNPGDFRLSVRAPIVYRTTFGIPKRLTSGYVRFDNGFVPDRTPTFIN